MAFWPLSDVLSTHPPTLLSPTIGKGTFLPHPSVIWGAQGNEKLKMLETLTVIWKLLVVRPCLFRRGDLSPENAYLNSQAWRDILKCMKSDTTLATMWTRGKPELWGEALQVPVVRRVNSLQEEPTLARMDCVFRCSPIGKFGDDQDPHHRLQHFVLFRLIELHILHDFASYHPTLQDTVSGRWCPPPFDAQDILVGDPGAFSDLTVEVSPEEEKAMDNIVRIVRWNGVDGLRPWQMPDGQPLRDWLTAFRAILDICPDAWIENPVLQDLTREKGDLDLLACNIQSPDAPLGTITRLLIGTHLLLTMRAGRLPWLWFNKPDLNHVECVHNL